MSAETLVLIIATSLRQGSHSLILAREAHRRLIARAIEAELLWLGELDLPFCGDAEGCVTNAPDVDRLKIAAARATHILFAVPIYNGDVNGATRNVLNLGADLKQKTVGFLCAAGGNRSYLAVFSLANSLMFDFQCWIVPKFVYATGGDFADGRIATPDIFERIERLIDDLLSRPAPERMLAAAAATAQPALAVAT